MSDLLRQPAAEVRALQDRLLRRTVELCHRGHPFYRRLMRQHGLRPEHIQSCDDLTRLPPTTKQDFLADPEAFRLQLDDLPLDQRTLWKVIYTTGAASGAPAPIYVTSYDHFGYLDLVAQRKELLDLRDTDVVANLFPLTLGPMGAYSRAVDEAAACGAAVVLAHPGRPAPPFQVHRGLDDVVRLIERQRATVLYGIASFVQRVLAQAQQMAADFSQVRLAMITGEPASALLREDIRARMHALGCREQRLLNRYGSTEQGVSMVECAEGSGFHSIGPDHVFHEVVHPDTSERLADGQQGMLALSHLTRRGTVFLRYLVGDVVSMSHAPCPRCGRTSPRVTSSPVRSGELVKVRGTLVNLRAVRDQVQRQPAVRECQILVRPSDPTDALSSDELAIRLVVAPGDEAPVQGAVTAAVERVAHLKPRVEFVAAGDIFDTSEAIKPAWVRDLRPGESQG
ncbi:MAG: phenylacetate--CoA ligase family protein [Micromonosporaceae bacterium]